MIRQPSYEETAAWATREIILAIAVAMAAAAYTVARGPELTGDEVPVIEAPHPSARAVGFDASGCDHPHHGPSESASLAGVSRISLGRVPVHYPMAGRGWPGHRLELASNRGPGAIVFVELPSGPCYLGRGALRGWSQEGLSSVFQRLALPADEMSQNRKGDAAFGWQEARDRVAE